MQVMMSGWETVGATLGQEDTEHSQWLKKNSGPLGKQYLRKITKKVWDKFFEYNSVNDVNNDL